MCKNADKLFVNVKERDADVLFKVWYICCACGALGRAHHLESLFDSCFGVFFHLNVGKFCIFILWCILMLKSTDTRRTVETCSYFPVPCLVKVVLWCQCHKMSKPA